MAPSIPDRWLDYKPIGKRIEGTRFIAFKVPLREHVSKTVDEHDRLDRETLLRKVPGLGLIIDLTNTHRYYDPDSFQVEGVEHRKLMIPGHATPPEGLIKQFKLHVRSFLDSNKDNDKLIGVHCTHGVNRTGYVICNYMISELTMEPKEAIKRFDAARGHKIERENYLEALHNLARSGAKSSSSSSSSSSKESTHVRRENWRDRKENSDRIAVESKRYESRGRSRSREYKAASYSRSSDRQKRERASYSRTGDQQRSERSDNKYEERYKRRSRSASQSRPKAAARYQSHERRSSPKHAYAQQQNKNDHFRTNTQSGNSFRNDNYRKDNYSSGNYGSSDNYRKDSYRKDSYGNDKTGNANYSKLNSRKDDYSKDNYRKDSSGNGRHSHDTYNDNRHGTDSYRTRDTKPNYSNDKFSNAKYSNDNYRKDNYPKHDHGTDKYSNDKYGTDNYRKDSFSRVHDGNDKYAADKYSADKYSSEKYGTDKYSADKYSNDKYRTANSSSNGKPIVNPFRAQRSDQATRAKPYDPPYRSHSHRESRHDEHCHRDSYL